MLRHLTRRPVTGLEVLAGPDSAVPEERRDARRPLEAYALDGIDAEWFPPRWAHTGDRSGFDIAACVGVEPGRRLLLSIEVKYTDSFSSDLVTWERYGKWLAAIDLHEPGTRILVADGCSQILRQVMITDSVRRVGLVPEVGATGQVQEAMAVVLARADDDTACEVVAAVDAAVSVPVLFWSHKELFDAAAAQPALSNWAREMADRYLICD